MIHMLQCMCGPERHCIMGILYDDKKMLPEDALHGLKALIEMQVDHRILRARCEICGKDIGIEEFIYEDHATREQDWEKAHAVAKRLEDEQRVAQIMVKAQRSADRRSLRCATTR